MPPGQMTIQKFIEALRTGQTDITKGIDQLFANPSALKDANLYQQLKQDGALDTLSPEMRELGKESGVTDKEMDHIDKWPNDQKEQIRQKMVQAVEGNRTVHIFWELHRHPDEAVEIIDPDENGNVTVIFLSPRRNLNVPDGLSGDVFVEIG